MTPAEILAFVRELMLLGLVFLIVVATIRGGGGGSGHCCPEASP